MIPILFEYNETSFTSHGIGDLVDCIECKTKQTDEGEFELSLKYPADGQFMNELTIGRLIYAKANPWQSNQIFRIYGYEKDIKQTVIVNCQHISYDLANIPCKAFKLENNKSASANDVLGSIRSNAVSVSGLSVNSFTLYSDVSGTAQIDKGYFYIDSPTTVRAAILDGDDSVKGCFGGDLVFDNYTVKLLAAGGDSSDPLAGKDRGVVIEYGVDLMDMNQEENISEMVTGVLPYFTYTDGSEDNNQEIFYGSVQYASGTFRTHKVAPLDLTSYFPNQEEHTHPSANDLNSKAAEWMNAEDGFGRPEISMTVSYAALGQDVRMHDAVKVRFVKMGIEVPSKVCGYTYDVLRERITEVEIGRTKQMAYLSFEDASRLRKGLLPPERIQNKSLTADKYEDGSIGTSALSNGAVSNGKIGGNAVTSDKVKPYEIKTVNLADSAVTTVKINDYAVEEVKVGNSAITSTKIKSGEVKTVNLADGSVQYKKISNGQVDTLKLNDFSISSYLLDGSSSQRYRTYPDGTRVAISEAVVEMKIGDKEVAVAKLDDDGQGGISAAWEFNRIKADLLTVDDLEARFEDVDHLAVRKLEAYRDVYLKGYYVDVALVEGFNVFIAS